MRYTFASNHAVLSLLSVCVCVRERKDDLKTMSVKIMASSISLLFVFVQALDTHDCYSKGIIEQNIQGFIIQRRAKMKESLSQHSGQGRI